MEKMPKNADFFECQKCNFKCSKKSNYKAHLLTRKHQNRTILNEKKQKNALPSFQCEFCSKIYKKRNSFWYHQQKCMLDNNEDVVASQEGNVCDKDLVIMVMKQQQELMKQNTDFQNKIIEEQTSTQKMMLEVLKNGTHNNNSHNKTFNLQVFLNETCKNAMNLSDFIKSVNIQINDLEKIGELGYVDGISDIIIRNLQDLEVEKRPMHCTDAKREILYVKDEDKWEREEKEKKRIKGAINQVAAKNIQALLEYRDKNPSCVDPTNEDGAKFNQMLLQVLENTDEDNKEKVVKKLSKGVVLDKLLEEK